MTPDPDAEGTVRVAILDDHALIVDGLAAWIGEHAPDLDVAIRTTQWLDLIRHPEFPVDLVLMDLQLGDSVSIESRIRACRAAGASVVVVTALDDAESRERCLAAGADGFVSKTQPLGEVVGLARRALLGGRGGAVAVDGDPAAGGVAAPSDAALSAAERRAVALYVQGRSTADVAAAMDVGYETAKTYLRRARDKYAKVGRPAGRRAELIRRAAEDGMLE
ncbi:response regulator [Agromyces sp. GXS1127]|uniref:response regulator transcription factor n=1 Tax=Agromyces sp. GXS1127 TaxID=3424181 RepID=UPI003D31F6E4